MSSKWFVMYRGLLKLYPKSYRRQFGRQMMQTLEDILLEQHSAKQRFSVWLRAFGEMPGTIVGEHLNTMEERMGATFNKFTKKQIVVTSIVISAVVLGAATPLLLNRGSYMPTTLSELQNKDARASCIRKDDNSSLTVPNQAREYIANAVVMSIIDVPAGTNVDVYLNSYDGSGANGTAIYAGTYGKYNFTVSKSSENVADDYAGGWTATRFVACD